MRVGEVGGRRREGREKDASFFSLFSSFFVFLFPVFFFFLFVSQNSTTRVNLKKTPLRDLCLSQR